MHLRFLLAIATAFAGWSTVHAANVNVSPYAVLLWHDTDCRVGITTARADQVCGDRDNGALWACKTPDLIGGNDALFCDQELEWQSLGGGTTGTGGGESLQQTADIGRVVSNAASVGTALQLGETTRRHLLYCTATECVWTPNTAQNLTWKLFTGFDLNIADAAGVPIINVDNDTQVVTFAQPIMGSVTGSAATATALTTNPLPCTATQFVTDIAATGTLTCAPLTDADIPNTLTLDTYQPLDTDLTQVADLDCANDLIMKQVGGVWTCAADAGGASLGDTVAVGPTGLKFLDLINATQAFYWCGDLTCTAYMRRYYDSATSTWITETSPASDMVATVPSTKNFIVEQADGDDLLTITEAGVMTATAATTVNFGSAAATAPSKFGTTPPGTCTDGQTYVDTDAANGSNWLVCKGAAWVVQGAGGSFQAADPDLTEVAGLTCATNEIMKQSAGGAWTCAVDGGGTGTLTAPATLTADPADGPATFTIRNLAGQNRIRFGTEEGDPALGSLYFGDTTASATNYALQGDGTATNLNGPLTLHFATAGVSRGLVDAGGFTAASQIRFNTVSPDVGLARAAPNALEVTNATVGQPGSLITGFRDAATTTLGTGLTIRRQSSGTAADGLGASLLYQLNSSTTPNQDAARVDALWTTALHGSRDAALVTSVALDGVLTEAGRWRPDGLQVPTLIGTQHDTPPTCSGGVFWLYPDNSEDVWKKCENGVVSIMDTGGVGGGLGDPGGAGLVKRTTLNTTVVATPGTDYVVPAGSITGNAATATALAGDPTNCPAGTWAAGITATGVGEGCTDLATQTEFSTYTTLVAAAGTLNAGGNPVDWTQLKNVPPSFADNADDIGGDALTSQPLSQFASTDPTQLAAVLSGETGTGAPVFGTGPTIASLTTTGPLILQTIAGGTNNGWIGLTGGANLLGATADNRTLLNVLDGTAGRLDIVTGGDTTDPVLLRLTKEGVLTLDPGNAASTPQVDFSLADSTKLFAQAAGAAPTADNDCRWDATSHRLECGENGVNRIVAWTSDVAGSAPLNHTDTVAPGPDNDTTQGYSVFSRWVDTTTNTVYVATSVTTGLAVWQQDTDSPPPPIPALQDVYDASGATPILTLGGTGLTYANAISQASAVRICKTAGCTEKAEWYWDPTAGFTFKVTPTQNLTFEISDTLSLIYNTDGQEFMRINEITRAIEYGSNNLPYAATYWSPMSVDVDGTNCTAATSEVVNGSEKIKNFSCQDGGKFTGQLVLPLSYSDNGALSFRLKFRTLGTSSVTAAYDVSAWCRGANDPIDSTYSTVVSCDVTTGTTANLIKECNVNFTPNGTCAGGDLLSWRAVIDDATNGATAAHGKILGGMLSYPRKKDRE